jgi:exodeoxyribonuclease V gamma subunit
LRAEGLRRPLPFAPYSAWALYRTEPLERGLQAAARQWRGGDYSWAEGDSDALRVALRGRDPFADAGTQREFARLAGIVFGAVTMGLATPIDAGQAALPEADDAEDAA